MNKIKVMEMCVRDLTDGKDKVKKLSPIERRVMERRVYWLLRDLNDYQDYLKALIEADSEKELEANG